MFTYALVKIHKIYVNIYLHLHKSPAYILYLTLLVSIHIVPHPIGYCWQHELILIMCVSPSPRLVIIGNMNSF